MSQPVSGGVAVCVRDQVRFATQNGYEVRVASPSSEVGPLQDWVSGSGAQHIALPMERRPGLRDLAHFFELRRLMGQSNLVHLHSSKAGALGRLAAITMRKSRRPAIVFTPHAWSWLVGGRLSTIYRGLERALQGLADRIIAVSSGEAAEGRSVLGSKAPISVISNGVDLDRFSPDLPPSERSQDPLVVCVGRFATQKGQDVAIEALSLLNSSTARLRLVGDGEMETALRHQAAGLGVAERIEWVGATADPGPHMRAADVMIVPSRWDGLSLVLLEGMASGAAIVATRVGGSEVAEGSARIVEPNDASALASAIDGLLADAEERQRLGRSARERAEDFGLDQTLELTGALWAALSGPQGDKRL